MYVKHALFLRWLIYAVLVAFFIVGGWYFGIIQFVLFNDSSYLSFLIVAVYIVAEIYLGRQTYLLSSELHILEEFVENIKGNKLTHIDVKFGNTIIGTNNHIITLKESILSSHIARLYKRGIHSQNEQTLSGMLTGSILNKVELGTFFANLLISIGMFGTMAGLIMAFAPFIGSIMGFDLSNAQVFLVHIFSGVGTAFFTTATGMFLSIILQINTQHLYSSCSRLVDGIIRISETEIIPCLEKKNAETE